MLTPIIPIQPIKSYKVIERHLKFMQNPTCGFPKKTDVTPPQTPMVSAQAPLRAPSVPPTPPEGPRQPEADARRRRPRSRRSPPGAPKMTSSSDIHGGDS